MEISEWIYNKLFKSRQKNKGGIETLEWIYEWRLRYPIVGEKSYQSIEDQRPRKPIRVEALGNPGWSVEIDLKGTPMEHWFHESPLHKKEEDDWYFFNFKDSLFDGSGTIKKLGLILDKFKEIAENSGEQVQRNLPENIIKLLSEPCAEKELTNLEWIMDYWIARYGWLDWEDHSTAEVEATETGSWRVKIFFGGTPLEDIEFGLDGSQNPEGERFFYTFEDGYFKASADRGKLDFLFNELKKIAMKVTG